MSIKVSLMSKISKYNPKWKNELFDFLQCKIDHLTSSKEDDIEGRPVEYELDMNVGNKCVVGEVYCFTFDGSSCPDCEHFSMALFHENNSTTKERFANKLEEFYVHIERDHPELSK